MKHIDYYLDVIQQNKTESTGGGITPSGTKEISIVQNGESTEDVTRYASAHIVVDVPMPEPPTGVKEISVTENGVSTHDVSAFAQAEVTVAVPEPAGEKQITTNGKHDVKAFASVDVNVPSEGITPTGTKEITSNGTHDVTQYAQAKVNVPIPAEPAGTKDITENGVHDIKAFANVNVQVPVGVTPQGTKEISVTENGEKTEDVTNFKNVHIVTNVQSSGGGTGVPQEKYDALVSLFTFSNQNVHLVNEDMTSLCPYAFYYRTNLISAILNGVTNVEYSVFQGCSKLSSIEMNSVETIGNNAFLNASSLQEVVFPKLSEIGSSVFSNCSALKKVKCDKATAIQYGAFTKCPALEVIDILGGRQIAMFTNDKINSLKSFVIREATRVTPLSSGIFGFSDATTIYVADNLVEEYKVATNWSRYADKIKPISEYVEV